ncbi:uncharacterized protein PHACADRAFT_213094 [Phanerochaete carnosa HHB-10118-sp]|uniref:Uncharacterized protein n=1 Tax=Phanerochaete carnosa (strain HHB-10118-sp) TaxID=650164 RepID=K5VWP1_PHACS|nr:uncharacterized protein PHACADRAFT_213094 [Phanerochaete carnosa HHB-10118-sp]EKM51225.1 hypothetical protein PHACADRAFT_213094 [Phanerochaete carnosa HHB-10118-sp]
MKATNNTATVNSTYIPVPDSPKPDPPQLLGSHLHGVRPPSFIRAVLLLTRGSASIFVSIVQAVVTGIVDVVKAIQGVILFILLSPLFLVIAIGTGVAICFGFRHAGKMWKKTDPFRD